MRLVSAAVLAAALAGCSSAESSPPPSRPTAPAPVVQAAARPPEARRPRLVFFLNPNGMPCRIQDDVLHAMPDLAQRAELVYFRTTEPGDLAAFQRYGIRSLPQLVVTDDTGRELRRATPGVQTDAQVRALLAP